MGFSVNPERNEIGGGNERRQYAHKPEFGTGQNKAGKQPRAEEWQITPAIPASLGQGVRIPLPAQEDVEDLLDDFAERASYSADFLVGVANRRG